MRKRNIALILAASMMATFAFGGTTTFAAEEGKNRFRYSWNYG